MLKSGQIQFVNGGVSTADEGCIYYEDFIDNMTWGHQWIENNFGKDAIPTVGWQLDSFGHS